MPDFQSEKMFQMQCYISLRFVGFYGTFIFIDAFVYLKLLSHVKTFDARLYTL